MFSVHLINFRGGTPNIIPNTKPNDKSTISFKNIVVQSLRARSKIYIIETTDTMKHWEVY